MIIKLLTEHHLEFLRLKGGCRDSSESTHVKMPHCWKSHALAQLCEIWNLFHLNISRPAFIVQRELKTQQQNTHTCRSAYNNQMFH